MKAAIYARYSTDKQSEASIPDQFRQCERLAERAGFTVAARFQDAAISGGTAHRPGYQQLLAAARRREIDVVVAEDTSRLWRNLAEQAPRIAELRDLGVHVVCHDLDTRQESSVILGAVLGAMGEGYRAEIGRRTRRGLEGRARAKKPTGGRAYGYISAAQSGTGEREIHREEAAVVVRIFQLYRDGASPRAIADQLNADGVPSPGSTWSRTERRRQGWLASAIAGDTARGLGILNNELYAGRVIWNKCRWVRSAADSKRRRAELNPPQDWIVHEEERLRILPESLWLAVKARQRQQARNTEQLAEGKRRPGMKRTGREGSGPKFLLSGLLHCSRCGARYVMGSASSYVCSSYVNGGKSACPNDVRFRRDKVEAAILEAIQRDFSNPAAADEVCKRLRARLREATRGRPVSDARIAKLEREVGNMVEAVASLGLRGSIGLSERLRAAEAELAELKAKAAATDTGNVERLLPEVATRYTRELARLPELLTKAGNVPRVRATLASHYGEIQVRPEPGRIGLWAQQGHMELALLAATSGGVAISFGSGGTIR
ncbi:MAG: recombinase family protein [Steroidobacteraceae bacterium]|nr:recombinase family protein [Nevskiaceae bacterium]MCP5472286.1 recombinase family protein [Nevskiaceae bacterium]